ncbi:MAG: hypothetical protein ACI8P7_001141, partial [Candidatus Azotimanducaceae bacterium]
THYLVILVFDVVLLFLNFKYPDMKNYKINRTLMIILFIIINLESFSQIGCPEIGDVCGVNLICGGSFERFNHRDSVASFNDIHANFEFDNQAQYPDQNPDLIINQLLNGIGTTVRSVSCGNPGLPIGTDGDVYLGIGYRSGLLRREGFVLATSTTMMEGRTYTLTFDAIAYGNSNSCPSNVNVVFSNNEPCPHEAPASQEWEDCGSFTQGTPDFTIEVSNTTWSQISVEVTVPSNGGNAWRFVTISTDHGTTSTKSYVLIDNVRMEFTPENLDANVGPDLSVCEGDVINLDGIYTGGYGVETYQWALLDGPVIATTQNYSFVAPDFDGTFTYVFTVRDSCSIAMDTISVILNPTPVVYAGNDLVFCEPQSGYSLKATLVSPSNGSGYTYTWYDPNDLTMIKSGDGRIHLTKPITQTTTYYVVATSPDGCKSDPDSIIIHIESRDLDITYDGPKCGGNMLTVSGSGFESTDNIWFEKVGEGVESTGSSDLVLNNAKQGDQYIFHAKDQTYNCNYASEILTIDVYDTPELTVPNDTTICEYQQLTLRGSYTGNGDFRSEWELPNQTIYPGNAVNTGQLFNNYNGNGNTFIYRVFNSDNETCYAEESVTIFIETRRIYVTMTDVSGSYCEDEEIIFTGNGAQAGDLTWFEDGWGNVLCSPCNSYSVINPTYNKVNFKAISSNPRCYFNATMQFNVYPKPDFSITGTNEICSGETPVLQGNASPPQHGTSNSYAWTPNSSDYIISGSNTLSPTFNSITQTTTFTLTGTSSQGCVDSFDFEVRVEEIPNVDAGTDVDICYGESATLNATGAPNYTWSIVPSNGWTQGGSSLKIAPTQTTTYQVRGYSDLGCESFDQVTVKMNENPEGSISQSHNACLGDPVTLTFATNSGVNYIKEWVQHADFNCDPCTGDQVTVAPSVATTYRINLTDPVTGCTDYRTYKVQPLHPGYISFSANPGFDICEGENVTITVNNNSSIYTYKWINGVDVAKQYDNPLTLTPSATATYTVETTKFNGCKLTEDVTVIVHANPTVSINTNQTEFCLGDEIQLTANGLNHGTYYWTSNNGSPISNRYSQSITSSPSQTTTYLVTVTAPDGYCSESQSITITKEDPIVSITQSATEICLGESVTITSDVSGTYTYLWTPSNGVGNTAISNPVITPTVTTSYNLKVTSGFGCVKNIPVNITVNPKPIFTGVQVYQSCSGTNGVQINFTADTPWNYTSTTDGLSCTDCTNPIANPTVTTGYIMESTNEYGCTASFGFLVEVLPRPTVDAGPDMTICEGDTICLYYNAESIINADPIIGHWTQSVSGQYMAPANEDMHSTRMCVAPKTTTSYCVYGVDANGCISATDCMTMTVIPQDNKVPNGDFEAGILPDSRDDLEESTGWIDATGTPDLFDEDYTNCLGLVLPACNEDARDYNCMSVPCNHYGDLAHNNLTGGQRYAGLWFAVGTDLGVLNDAALHLPLNEMIDPSGVVVNPEVNPLNQADLRLVVEGMEVKLTQKLVVGTTYEITFYVSKAQKGNTTDLLVDKEAYFHVKMSTKEEHGGLLMYDPTNATIIHSGYTRQIGSWQKVTIPYKAKKAFDHLIIESTYPFDLAERISTTNLGVSWALPGLPVTSYSYDGIESYLFVDDIEIKQSCAPITVGFIALAGDDRDFCEGNTCTSVTLGSGGNSAQGGLAAYSYQWEPANLFIGQSSTFARPTVCISNTTTFTLTVTDANGSQATDNVTITMTPKPTVNAGSDIEWCSGQCFTIGSSASNGNAPYTYSWTGPNGFTSTLARPQACDMGTYTVVVTDANGCESAPSEVRLVYAYPGSQIVPNSGFSLGATPAGRQEIEKASGWRIATGHPDLFDEDYCVEPTCKTAGPNFNPNGVDIDKNYAGEQDHRLSGTERYAGLWAYNGESSAWNATLGIPQLADYLSREPLKSLAEDIDDRLPNSYEVGSNESVELIEAIEIKLNQTMDVGKEYTIGFYASLADMGELRGSVSPSEIDKVANMDTEARFNVKFSTQFESNNSFEPVDGVQIYSDVVTSNSSWQYFDKTFTARQPFNYLIIESIIPKGSGTETFFYLDDVTLVEGCAVAAKYAPPVVEEESEIEASYSISLFPNPTQGALTLQYEDLVSVSSSLEIMDASGSVVMKKTFGSGTGSMSLDISNLPEGMYFYHIIDINKDVLKRDKIVLVK